MKVLANSCLFIHDIEQLNDPILFNSTDLTETMHDTFISPHIAKSKFSFLVPGLNGTGQVAFIRAMKFRPENQNNELKDSKTHCRVEGNCRVW